MAVVGFAGEDEDVCVGEGEGTGDFVAYAAGATGDEGGLWDGHHEGRKGGRRK